MALTAAVVDSAFIYILVFSLLLFFAIVFLMVYFLVRYRRARNPRPTEIEGHTGLEVLWIVLSTLLVLTMFFYGVAGFRFLRGAPGGLAAGEGRQPAVGLVVRIPQRPEERRPGRAGLGRNLRLEMSSQDVIHSFFVPALRIKQDTVPGMTTYTWFRASQTGTYDILCAEYCGERHSAMLAKLIVLPPAAVRPVVLRQGRWRRPAWPAPSAQPAGEDLLRQKGCLGCHSTDGSRAGRPHLQGALRPDRGGGHEGRRGTSITVDDAYLRTSILTPSADLVSGLPRHHAAGQARADRPGDRADRRLPAQLR